MIITFWIAIGLWLPWLLLSATAIGAMDSWGEHVLPFVYLSAFLAVVVSAVFIGWFALHSLGVSIHYGGS